MDFLHGLNSRLGPDGTQVTGGENKKDSSRGTKIREAGRHNSSNPLTPPGIDAGYIPPAPLFYRNLQMDKGVHEFWCP